MAFGFVILAVLGLMVVAVLGMGIWAVPVVLVGLASLAFLFANRARRAAKQTEAGTPQDTHTVGTHRREDYAHTGQAFMTPDQMKRVRT